MPSPSTPAKNADFVSCPRNVPRCDVSAPLSPVFLAIIASQEPIDAHQAAEQAHAERHEEFGRASYLFCHDPDFGKQGTMGADFCAIFDEASFEVCPRPPDKAAPGLPQNTPGPRGNALCGLEARPSAFQNYPKSWDYSSWASRCACIVGWILRTILAQRWASDHHGDPEEDIEPSGPEPGKIAPTVGHGTCCGWPKKQANGGDRVEAVTFLHLAVLRYLDDTGLARFHPSKTNGDYLRGVRPHRSVFNVLRGGRPTVGTTFVSETVRSMQTISARRFTKPKPSLRQPTSA